MSTPPPSSGPAAERAASPDVRWSGLTHVGRVRANNEDVFLALHDTDEGLGTKELVGLASGKYRVEPSREGRAMVMNGLGIPVTGGNGQILNPEEFSALLRRVAQGQVSDADRNIFVTRTPRHEKEDNPELEKQVKKIFDSPLRQPAQSGQESASKELEPGATKPGNTPTNIQQNEAATEESGTGSSHKGWIFAFGALIGLVSALYFALRR